MRNLICDFCSSDQRFARRVVYSPHPASFEFHLAMDTLAFGYILPTTGRIPDLHRLETCAAGRTHIKKPQICLKSGACFLSEDLSLSNSLYSDIYSHNLFFHPDFTVGSGISPDQPLAQVADFSSLKESPPVGNRTPPRRTYFLFICCQYNHFFLSRQSFFTKSVAVCATHER